MMTDEELTVIEAGANPLLAEGRACLTLVGELRQMRQDLDSMRVQRDVYESTRQVLIDVLAADRSHFKARLEELTEARALADKDAEQLRAKLTTLWSALEAWEMWAREAEPQLKSQASLAYAYGMVYLGPVWPRSVGQAALMALDGTVPR